MGSKPTSKQDVLAAIQLAQSQAEEYIKSGLAAQEDRYELCTAADNLTDACGTPVDRAKRYILEGPCPTAALRIAIEAGWTRALTEREIVTAEELAKESGATKNVVVRIMRVMTASKIAKEVGKENYAATELLRTMLLPGMVDLFKHATDSVFTILTKLPLYLSNTSFQEPEHQGIGPHAFTFGKSLYERNAAEPELNELFNRAMMITHTTRGRPCDSFPFDTKAAALNLRPEDVFLVDIGGGMGHMSVAIKQLFPDIPGRIIVQDLPHVFEHARQQTELLKAGFEFQAHDMFMPEPVVGAAFYFFSAVFHNWLDGKSLKVLKHVRQAMKPGYSKLLIADWVLPDTGARLADASLDLWMMVVAEDIHPGELVSQIDQPCYPGDALIEADARLVTGDIYPLLAGIPKDRSIDHAVDACI